METKEIYPSNTYKWLLSKMHNEPLQLNTKMKENVKKKTVTWLKTAPGQLEIINFGLY